MVNNKKKSAFFLLNIFCDFILLLEIFFWELITFLLNGSFMLLLYGLIMIFPKANYSDATI